MGIISDLEIRHVLFCGLQTLHFTVSSTMDELYRMDCILEMQDESSVKQLQNIVSIYCLKNSTNFNRSESSFPVSWFSFQNEQCHHKFDFIT